MNKQLLGVAQFGGNLRGATSAFLTYTKLINNLLKIELESTQMKLLSN